MALAAAIIVLAAGYASLTRKLTIMADGRLVTIQTRALTIGGVLKAAGVPMDPQDKVEPAAWFLAGDGMIINLVRAAHVRLLADGKIYTIVSAERDPQALLARFGFKLNEGDRLLLAGRTLQEDEQLPQTTYLSLELRHPVSIRLEDGDDDIEFQSSAPTLGEALAEQGIELLSSDRLDPGPQTALSESISAILVRSEPLLIIMREKGYEVRTSASTVGEVLAETGIALQGLDRSEPDEDQPLPSDRRIRIVRINETMQLEQEVIPFQIAWQQDPEAELGTTSVIQEGSDGVSAKRVRTRYENGVEVSHSDEEARVLQPAMDQINGYGGDIQVRTVEIDGVEIEYWATLSVYVTSYSPCRSGVDGCLYGTSSGVPVQKGVVSTYLDWYRAYKGGSIYVPGYGPAVFGDVGRYPDDRPWIDLGYSDADYVGWSSWVTIYFTTPIPASIPYFLQ
jgi:uncharacterized protein YabE (DUF348 family)